MQRSKGTVSMYQSVCKKSIRTWTRSGRDIKCGMAKAARS